ncbi:MAG: PilX N-terminal domain-containing pilus assembly protein [Pseudomonadota bacterium]
MMIRMHHKQSGSVLMISLVMLVMLTLFVLTVINTTNINSRIARNMQTEAEAQAAAQQAIEQVISVDFTPAPASVAGNLAVDVNNDGTTDYTVAVAVPTCTGSVPIKTVDLDIAKPSDAACLGSGAVAAAGIVGLGGSGNSLCSNSRWDVRASTTDPVSGATNVTIHQGVAVRVAIGTAC